jgi:hypothetical protein
VKDNHLAVGEGGREDDVIKAFHSRHPSLLRGTKVESDGGGRGLGAEAKIEHPRGCCSKRGGPPRRVGTAPWGESGCGRWRPRDWAAVVKAFCVVQTSCARESRTELETHTQAGLHKGWT